MQSVNLKFLYDLINERNEVIELSDVGLLQ